jgi:hypothetical protein
MKHLNIFIENNPQYQLIKDQITYVFDVLSVLAGIPYKIIGHSTEDIDIYFGLKPEISSKLFIQMQILGEKSFKEPESYIKVEDIIYLLFNKNQKKIDFLKKENNQYFLFNDFIFTCFYLLTGMQEKYIKRDKNDSHLIEQSFLYKNNLLHIPIINQYVSLIKKIFKDSHEFIPIWPDNKKFAVALTHDVDYPQMIKTIECLRYIKNYKSKLSLKKIIDILQGKESFWKFKEYIELEKKYNLKSGFYFCGFKGNLFRYIFKVPDTFYNIKKQKFKNIMKFIKTAGFEVGMHASFMAYKDKEQFLKEKNNIEVCLEDKIFGNRHHYFHFNQDNPEETMQVQAEIGLVYDSSIVFEKHSGFRRGICLPYKLFSNSNMKTLQIPTGLMDDHLFGYKKWNNFADYKQHIDSVLDSVVKYNGIFMADYHIRVLNNTFFLDWGNSYIYLLDKIKELGNYYNDTPLNIAEYWIKRADKIKELSNLA